MRANERFSGAGHARHLCKDCQKLGADELAYRQAVRDIDRMVQWETGRIKRKQRANFDRFLRHPNERVRRYAEDVLAGRIATVTAGHEETAESARMVIGADEEEFPAEGDDW